MIVKTPKHPGYGKYFLAMEAPGDPPLRKNMKVITVRPNRRARLDFTSNDLVVSDEPDPELPEIDDPVDSDVDLPEVDDGDVGVDDLPEVDDDPSLDLPDIDPSQTQNDPDQDLPSIDEPAEPDLPEIDPDGSSDDLPEIDEPDVDVDLPEVDDDPSIDLPEVDDDPSIDLPEVDDDPSIDLPEVDDDPSMDLPEVDDDPSVDLPDVEDDYDIGDEDLPDIDDPVQSTNIPVTPDTNGEEDYSSDNPQQTNVSVNPTDDTGDEDFANLPAVDGQPNPPVDATGSAPPPADASGQPAQANNDNTDYTKAPQGDQNQQPANPNDPNAQQGQQGTNQDNTNNQKRGPGLEYDSVRKYNLYKEYAKLRTAIDGYITKLEACISDDPRSNQAIKTATTKFRELYELITDYMMMKFELCTYIQNLLFYQRQITTVQLIFTLLKETSIMQQKDSEKESNSKKTRRFTR